MIKNQWFISIKRNEGDIFDLSNLKHNYPPKGFYWADPFLYKKDGINYLFYELYDYKKGVIAYSIINEDLTLSKPTIIIDKTYHLSYPFMIENKGELYIIPEAGASNAIRSFKCRNFPNDWVEDPPLVYGATGDNNIHKIGEYYFLFTTQQPQMKHDLIIAIAENIKGPWKKIYEEFNKKNNQRSAGNIFKKDGDLIRPTQNATGGYGAGIEFKKIILDIENNIYNEKVIHSIKPDWHPDIIGTHHFSFNDDLIVLDGKRKIDI